LDARGCPCCTAAAQPVGGLVRLSQLIKLLQDLPLAVRRQAAVGAAAAATTTAAATAAAVAGGQVGRGLQRPADADDWRCCTVHGPNIRLLLLLLLLI
jgi:hypothetical protein